MVTIKKIYHIKFPLIVNLPKEISDNINVPRAVSRCEDDEEFYAKVQDWCIEFISEPHFTFHDNLDTNYIYIIMLDTPYKKAEILNWDGVKSLAIDSDNDKTDKLVEFLQMSADSGKLQEYDESIIENMWDISEDYGFSAVVNYYNENTKRYKLVSFVCEHTIDLYFFILDLKNKKVRLKYLLEETNV